MKEDLNVVYGRPLVSEYTFYLDSEIEEPAKYRELFEALAYATPDDYVRIVINCYGGFLHSTTMICNSIRNSQATVVGTLNGVAASGGGLVLLSCDMIEVMPHSTFMAHTSIGSEYGKLSDNTKSIMSSNRQLDKFYRDTFEGFFSDEEVTDILEGKDVWLADDEIIDRLQKRDAHFKELAEQEHQAQQAEFMAMINEGDYDDWILNKLTKTQLIQLYKGEIYITDIDEANKKFVIKEDEEILEE